MEAATAMIFNSVSWWVLASHGMRRWTSPESVTDMRRSPLGEAQHPFADPVQSLDLGVPWDREPMTGKREVIPR